MSLNGMVLRIGQSVGPLLMGFTFVQWGLSSTFLLGGLLSFAMAATLAVIIRMRRVVNDLGETLGWEKLNTQHFTPAKLFFPNATTSL